MCCQHFFHCGSATAHRFHFHRTARRPKFPKDRWLLVLNRERWGTFSLDPALGWGTGRDNRVVPARRVRACGPFAFALGSLAGHEVLLRPVGSATELGLGPDPRCRSAAVGLRGKTNDATKKRLSRARGGAGSRSRYITGIPGPDLPQKSRVALTPSASDHGC